jgi:putative sigma-54 modulation protein
VRQETKQTGQHAVSVHIRIHDPELAEAARLHLDRALYAGLQRFAGRVRNVRVSLLDMNGPRGGVDKACRIEAKLFPSRRWVLQEVRDANVFAAITLAVQRVKYTMRLALEHARVWHTRRDTIRKRAVSAEEEEEVLQRIHNVRLHGPRTGELA